MLDILTPKEQEILVLMGNGLSNLGIAKELVVSYSTVRTHVNRIYSKLMINVTDESIHPRTMVLVVYKQLNLR